MNEHQRNTAFLRQCLLYHEAPERHQLEERLTEMHRNERCVRRAVWLMVLLISLATTGLCYSGIFLTKYPQNQSPFIVRILCDLGLASLICLMAFLSLGRIFRKELERRREECRRLAMKLMESRSGPPGAPSSPSVVKAPPVERLPAGPPLET